MRFPTLAAWLDWQVGLSPKSIDLGLERVSEVWNRLGPPQLDAAVITVAGTNGKGSSVAFIEAILNAAGYRCGCYTSPHLLHYSERIQIDVEPADDASICAAFERIDKARGDIRLTYFEFGTLAALLLFADARLDALVLEVGLGGRLDAVNIVDADVALITGIALDHQAWLGNDREAIGHEKAGVMRRARPAIFSGRDIPNSVREHAAAVGANLLVAGEDYRVQRHGEQWDLVAPGQVRRALPLPGLRGAVQVENAAGALLAIDRLADRLPVDQSAVRQGLLSARVRGRFEVRPGSPTWILDVAHNAQAAQTLSDTLGGMFTQGDRLAVCGMLEDKDAAAVAAALADRFDRWYLVDLSDQPRGLDSAVLAERIVPVIGKERIVATGSPEDVLARVEADCKDGDSVVVFGSFLTVAAAMAWLDRADDHCPTSG
ncbi:MAG: bifunctional tetrahydrofolate synthase/dihydrofolate synthase [Gammaproteobacteria bacterium]|nr:bifunctional tetrahydrofolate synthase/dihydrofolate synthase [Gammaproteobacteria bacterium]